MLKFIIKLYLILHVYNMQVWYLSQILLIQTISYISFLNSFYYYNMRAMSFKIYTPAVKRNLKDT